MLPSSHDDSVRSEVFSHLTGEETVAQRGSVTYPWSHSYHVAKAGCEARCPLAPVCTTHICRCVMIYDSSPLPACEPIGVSIA